MADSNFEQNKEIVLARLNAILFQCKCAKVFEMGTSVMNLYGCCNSKFTERLSMAISISVH